MQTDRHLIRLELPSSFEMLDLVQVLSDRLSSIAGLDEDTTHWVSVAVRESVINAVKHGNREDRSKHVTVEFTLAPRVEPKKFTVEVLDEGADCKDVITQLVAAQAALHRAGLRLMSAGMRYCLDDPEAAADAGMTVDDMEDLFLTLR